MKLLEDLGSPSSDRPKTGSQPFFLAVGMSKPHLPFAVPREFFDLLDPALIPLPRDGPVPGGMPQAGLTDSLGDMAEKYRDIQAAENTHKLYR